MQHQYVNVIDELIIFELAGALVNGDRLVGSNSSSSSVRAQPIQWIADDNGRSCATRIIESSNFQNPLPLKKYVLPVGTTQLSLIVS